MRTLSTAFFLALLACNNGGSIDIDDKSVDDGDDPITGDDDDDDDDDDVVEGALLEGSAPAGSTVTLIHIGSEEEGLPLGTVLGTAKAKGGSYSLELPDHESLDEDLFYSTDEDDAPNERIATFLLAAFDDADGNGEHDPGEDVLGGTDLLITVLRGGPSEAVEEYGGERGWNLLDGMQETATHIPDGTELDIPANLAYQPAGDLTVTIAPDLGTVNVDLYALTDEIGAEPLEPTVATALDVDASQPGAQVVFSGLETPPDDHFVEVISEDDAPPGVEIAAAYAIAYWDLNDSNELEVPGDIALAGSAEGASARVLFYMRPTDLRAVLWTSIGLDHGWNVVSIDDDAEELPVHDWSQGLVIVD